MISIGARTILALSCIGCGKFLQQSEIRYSRRKARDPRAYADRRCITCRWGGWAKGAQK